MNILWLSQESPLPANDGGRIRSYNLLKGAANNHKITFVTYCAQGVYKERIEPLLAFCKDVYFCDLPNSSRQSGIGLIESYRSRLPKGIIKVRSEKMVQLLNETLESVAFDLVHIDNLNMAHFRNILNRLPIVLDHPDLENLKQIRNRRNILRRKPLWYFMNWIEYRLWREFELEATGDCAVNLVVSPLEGKYFHEHIADIQVMVVPNGVDTNYFRPQSERHQNSSPPKIIYCGKMSYEPNVDAVIWLCNEIIPLIHEKIPDAQLLIVGRDPAVEVMELDSLKGVHVIGTVPDERPYYDESDVFVIPLRLGSGTRIKVPAAMSMGIPIISTSLGIEGITGLTAEEIVTADSPQEFSAAVIRLINDPVLRRRQADAAREKAKALFDWSISISHLERAYSLAASLNENSSR
jgi:hypothetical protein